MGKRRKREIKKEQDRIFNEYAFDYSDEKNEFIRNGSVELQRFVFDKLNERGLENTAIEKLLDMTLEDIECQHTIKTGIENKSGFILALWGILLSIVFNSENDLLREIKLIITSAVLNEGEFWITCILVSALIVTGGISLYYIYKSIKPHTYKKFEFDSKLVNFKSVAENKNITYTVLLDNVTNSWIQNRMTINKIANNYHKSIKWIIIFAIVLILSRIILT